MAKVTHKGKTVEVANGTKAIEAFEKLGIVYGCHSGNCGKCIVEIKSGMENLNEPQSCEGAFGLFDNERLFCQCIINGDVEVHQE